MASDLGGFLTIAPSNSYYFTNACNNDMLLYPESSNQRILLGTASNASAVLHITSNFTYTIGNLGVNNSNPEYSLDLVGDMNFTGAMYKNGEPYVPSQWTNNSSSIILYGSNVGINTSNPSERLDIKGANAKIGCNMYVMSNLGIGTSNPAFSLDIAGDINFNGILRSGGIPYIGSQWSNNNASNVLYIIGENIGINTSNVTEGLELSGVNAKMGCNVYVMSNLGIGTSNTAFPLDVKGDMNFTGTLRQNGVPYVQSQWSSNSSNVYIIGSNVGIGASSASEGLELRGVNAKLGCNLYIMSNVGIGTSNPIAALNVIGNAVFESNVMIFGSLTVSNVQYITSNVTIYNSEIVNSNIITMNILTFSNNGSSIIFGSSNSNLGIGTTKPLESLCIVGCNVSISNNSGKVIFTSSNNFLGINNSNPLTTVDIVGTTSFRGDVQMNNSVAIRGLTIYKRDGTMANITTTSVMGFSNDPTGIIFSVASNSPSNSFRFWGNAKELMRIGGNGFLGVGVSNPAYGLDISGDLNFSGIVRQNGAPYLGGNLNQWSNVSSNVFIIGSNIAIGKSNATATLDVAGTLNVSGITTVANNIMPLSNLVYDLGSSNMRFRSIYLGSNTIDMSGIQIHVDSETGGLKITDSNNSNATLIVNKIVLGTTSNSVTMDLDANNNIQFGTVTSVNGVTTSNTATVGGWSNSGSSVFLLSSNVGIGKSNPTSSLDVSGNINFDGTLLHNGIPYVGSQWSNNNSNVFLLGSNVGIGKSNPTSFLDVGGDINFDGALLHNGIPYVGSQWSNNNSNVFLLGSNVGIGLNNPSKKLDVSGDINFSGSLYKSGLVYIDSTAAYASNQVIINSNYLYPISVFTSNTAVYASNLGLSTLAANNTAIYGSNTAFYASNTAIAASNTAYATSNVSYGATATAVYASNTANAASNTAYATSNVSYGATATAVYASNTANAASNTAYATSNVSYGATATAVYASNTANAASNTAYATSNVSYGATATAVYASNTANAASNLVITDSNNLYPKSIFGSNTSVFTSNLAVTTSNTAFAASNTAIFGSNTAFAASNTAIFGSNTAIYTSNLVVTTSNTAFAASNTAIFGSNTALYASNTAIFASNLVVTTSNTAFAASNTAIFASNLVVTTSNTAFAASNTAIFASNLVVTTSNTAIAASNTAIAASNTAYTRISWSNNSTNVFLMSSNVGIGTSNPAFPLDVFGTIRGSNIYTSSNDNALLPSHSFYQDSNTGMFHASNQTLGFTAGGSEKMRITSSGFIGINNPAPSNNLDIIGTASIQGNLQMNGSMNVRGIKVLGGNGTVANLTATSVQGFSNDATGIILSLASNTSAYSLRVQGNTTEVMRITGNGNVGIGTSSPSYPLDISGDINFTGILRKANVPYVGSQWSNNSTNVFLLTSNVGIGTNNPAYPLDIFGNIHATSNLYIGSNVGPNGSNNIDPTGNTGNIICSGNMSYGNMGMFRNLIINGAMQINQRGTGTNIATTTSANNNWPADRFQIPTRTGGTMTYGSGLGVSDIPFSQAGITNYIRIGRTSGDTSTTNLTVVTNLETMNTQHLAGKTITFSYYYRTGATLAANATSGLFGGILIGTGTDANFLSTFNLIAQATPSYTMNTSWSRVTTTMTCPSTTNQACIQIWMGVGGTAGASDYFDITGLQLELGSFPTPFERRPYQIEIQLCQRYYYRMTSGSPGQWCGWVMTNAANSGMSGFLNLPVIMRPTGSIVPILTAGGGTGGNIFTTSPNIGNITTMGADLVSGVSPPNMTSIKYYSNGSSGSTSGQVALILSTTATSYIDVSAEL